MKFRKKPVTVEARQVRDDSVGEIVDWMLSLNPNSVKDWNHATPWHLPAIEIATPEGVLSCTDGNWVVHGFSKNLGHHFWPVEDGYFHENYEEVAND